MVDFRLQYRGVTSRVAFRAALILSVPLLLLGCQPAYRIGPMEDAAASRSPAVGQMAPEFTLGNAADEPVSLSSFRGKWVVLYFYPKDDTPGCVCQATEFTELLREFRDMGAEVIGISSDLPAVHRHFAEKYELSLILLSDPLFNVMSTYGAWVQSRLGQQSYGHIIRSTYIIDPEGRIRYHCPEVIPMGHASRIRKKLEALQQQVPDS